MTPNEYKKAAEKHLNFCLRWKKDYENTAKDPPKEYELLEIFYITGYIAECITIYTVYAFGGWNPTGITDTRTKKIRKDALEVDIEKFFDPVFTHHTKYDFYHHSIPPPNKNRGRYVGRKIRYFSNKQEDEDLENIKAGSKDVRKTSFDGKHYLWKINNEIINVNMADLQNCIDGDDIKLEDIKAYFFVSGHKFQDAIRHVICKNIASAGALNSITFFANFPKNSENTHKLINKWKPDIRYYSNIKQWEESFAKEEIAGMLKKEILFTLIDDLSQLYKDIIKI